MNKEGKIIVSISLLILFIIIGVVINSTIRNINRNKNTKGLVSVLDKIDTKFKSEMDIINKNLCNIPIYFINMERSRDRLQNMIRQIDYYKIDNIFRVEAIDGTNILNKHNDAYTFSTGDMLRFSIKDFNNYTKGELGCVLSHLNTIKCSYDRGDKYCLILEDDVYLGLIMLWEKSLCDIINDAPKNWGILQLFAGNTQVKDINEYRVWNDYWGMQSYIMNRQGMKEILDNVFNNNSVSISKIVPSPHICSDWLIYRIINNSHLKAYTTKALFIPNNNEMDSTIHTDHTHSHVSSSNNSLSMYSHMYEKFQTKKDYIIQQIKEDYKVKLKPYRLGDMILHRNQFSGIDYHLIDYPNSIASEYLKATPNKSDLPVLFEIIKKRTTPELKPDENTLLIHLRIGDVIDNSRFSVDELLSEGRNYGAIKSEQKEGEWGGHNYVKPLSYYQEVLEIIQTLPINKIILIGGYHMDGDHSKSEEYVSRIQTFFEENKYRVETRINEDPDEDFILMSNSTYFVQSGGGYSRLIVKMVEMNNNNVLK